jgi:hypothetical protein
MMEDLILKKKLDEVIQKIYCQNEYSKNQFALFFKPFPIFIKIILLLIIAIGFYIFKSYWFFILLPLLLIDYMMKSINEFLLNRSLLSDNEVNKYFNGWQLDVLKELARPSEGYPDKNNHYIFFDFTLNGLLQSFDIQGSQYDIEDARKLYGTLKLPFHTNIFVIVKFIVVSGKELAFWFNVDEQYDPNNPNRKNILNFGNFQFNTYPVNESLHTKKGIINELKIPFLDFEIILLPDEWNEIKEYLYLAQNKDNFTTIKIKVNTPSIINIESIIENAYSDTFYINRFWLKNIAIFDTRDFYSNLIYLADNDCLKFGQF